MTTRHDYRSRRFLAPGPLSLALCATLWIAAAPALRSAGGSANVYETKVLVANRPGLAPDAAIDEFLVNPWGIALRPPGIGGHFWLANAGNMTTTTYVGDAKGMPLHQDGLKVVFFDTPLISYEDGIANPTGVVYNAASDYPDQPLEFPVTGPASNLSKGAPVPIGVVSGAAKFVFVTTEGTVHAWRSNTAESMDRAVIVKDYSDHGPDQITGLKYLSAFTGVAMTTEAKTRNRLYITDFQNGIVRVLDHEWHDITAKVPFAMPANLPEDWSPYNIQLLGDRLYVAFAAIDRTAEEVARDVPAPGAGKVVAYDLEGRIVQEFADTGRLNSPWGVAIAPKNFGPFSGTLLVGNFGDGSIAAFDLATGKFLDYLRDKAGKLLEIDKLWGLAFGNGVSLGDADSLYFAAGPNDEQDGVFGRVRYAGPAPE